MRNSWFAIAGAGSEMRTVPLQSPILVLLYNAVQEGLYCASKYERSAFDLFALCLGTKSGFIKICKAH